MRKLMFMKTQPLYHHLVQLFTQPFQMESLYLKEPWCMALLLQLQMEAQLLLDLLSTALLLWGPMLFMVLFLQTLLSHSFLLEYFTATCLNIMIW